MKPKGVSDLEGGRGKRRATWFPSAWQFTPPNSSLLGVILLLVTSPLAHCWDLDLLSVHSHLPGPRKGGSHMLAPDSETKGRATG